MHTHPGYPATEVRPAAVTAQRSAHRGASRLHTGDAWPLVQLFVLNCVDLLNKCRCRRPRLDAGYAVSRIDQCNAHTFGARDRLSRELRHVPEKIDHPMGTGHDPGHTVEPCIQLGLVRFPLGRGEFGQWRHVATGLGVEVGQHTLLPYTLGNRQIYTSPGPD